MENGNKPQSYVTTTLAENMRAIAMMAHRHGMIAAIVAPSGVGKTTVLKALAKQTGGIYITVSEAMTGKDFLATLSAALGRRGKGGTRGVLHRWIVKRLAGTNKPIFVDEAHQLTKAIGCIRQIFDEANVSFILAGTLEILSLIDDRADGAGQFASRCVTYNALETMANTGDPGGGRFAGKQLFSQAEVEAFLANKRIKLTPDALRLAWSLACLPGFGSLRLVEHAAGVAIDLAGNAGDEITRGQLVAALKILHGIEFGRMEELAQRIGAQSGMAAVA